MLIVIPAPIANTMLALLPLTVRLDAPGPVIVRFWLIVSVPVVNVIVPVTLKLIVSPGAAEAIAARSEPAPASLVLMTVVVLADAGLNAADAITTTAKATKDKRLQDRAKRVKKFFGNILTILLASY
jgi:hypothetical protein